VISRVLKEGVSMVSPDVIECLIIHGG